MIHYVTSILLCELSNPEMNMVNFAASLTEVMTNVLDHEVITENNVNN
jgi:hypothetical protein